MNKRSLRSAGWAIGLSLAFGAIGTAVGASQKAPIEAEASTVVYSYERLTSIASIDESASYVLGIDGTGFHYSGTSSWGKTALPSSQTPLYYILTKGSGNTTFTATTTISNTTYYLTVPTSNTFTMSTSSGSIKLGTTTAPKSGETAAYAVTNTSTETRHLRINGSSGLRSYAGTTGDMAYFYKVVATTKYAVTYDANDGDGSMTDSSSPYTSGAIVTVKSNEFDAPTGKIFSKWNTLATGKGTNYEPGDTFAITADTTLFAQWVDEPTDPYVTVVSTLAGFTGKSDTLAFTYGCYTKALSVTSTNTSVASVAASSYSAGSGTVSIAFGSEGTATLEFWHGNDEDPVATCEVTVIASLNPVVEETDIVSDLTFTAACGGSGTTNKGETWAITSDGVESNFSSDDGIHYGTGSANVTYLQLATSSIPGIVSKVSVKTRDAQACAEVTVTVGGVSFKCGGKTTATATNTSTEYEFTGSSSGAIVVRVDRGSSQLKALYCKYVKVTHTGADYANKNLTAQRAVLEFVSDFNSEMSCDGDSGATENVSTKWATVSSSFTSKRPAGDNAAVYNNLFKYATSSESGDALQQMLARYDYIIKKYNSKKYSLGLTDFLSAEGGAGRDPVTVPAGANAINGMSPKASSLPLILVVVGVGLVAAGGLIFLHHHHRKED